MDAAATEFPWYFRSLDFDALTREFPPPPDFFRTVYRISRDELRSLQEKRFLKTMARGWEIAFFQRHWKAAGMEPGDIKGLDDLEKVPPYSVNELRESLERCPPFGDHMGVAPNDQPPIPLVLQTSGGTTGLPRPMLYTPQDRETMAILGARRYAMQGMRPGDIVLVAFSLGLSNGGFGNRETLWKYMGAVPIMTGSGATTPSRRQIELIKHWKITTVMAFPAYLRHLAIVARDELGIEPRSLGVRLLCTHLGVEDRDKIEELWGAPCFDSYGTHENGTIASECYVRNGMHLMEDAILTEIVDPETGRHVAANEKGVIYVTTLFRNSAPQIRFNINDVSSYVNGDCPCGCTLRRISKIFGRNDNMVKVRGVNVFTEAIGEVIARDHRSNGEFFCIVDRVGESGTDQLTVMVEALDLEEEHDILKSTLEKRLKEVIGLRMIVAPVRKGDLDTYTGLSQTSKIKRLLDRRSTS